MNSQQINEFITQNKGMDYAEIASKTGISVDAVRKRYRKIHPDDNKRVNSQVMQTTDPEKQFQLDLEKMRLHFAHKSSDDRYKFALKEIERLRGVIDTFDEMKDTVSTYEIKPVKSKRREAVAFAIASDWHVEENVKPETVDFTNEYNMRIAKKRAESFFRNTLKLVTKEQQDVEIETLVIALLGDFISGAIHDELMESCEARPVDAALFAQNLIASGIEYILANSKLKLVVPCTVGNHSRITDKVHVSTEQGNSLEWFIYCNLKEAFKSNPRVRFILSRGYFTWLTVYNYPIRFHHGHGIKYGGGIGGLTVPVIKAIARYDLDKKAYLDVFGHFHNRMDGGKFIVNGSLIGDAPYGKRLGFTGKPEQAFFLIDKDHGKTIVAPILIEG